MLIGANLQEQLPELCVEEVGLFRASLRVCRRRVPTASKVTPRFDEDHDVVEEGGEFLRAALRPKGDIT